MDRLDPAGEPFAVGFLDLAERLIELVATAVQVGDRRLDARARRLQRPELALVLVEFFLEAIEQPERVLERAEPAAARIDERVELVLAVDQAAALAVGLDLRKRTRQTLGAIGQLVKRRADRIEQRRTIDQLR